MYFVIVMMAGLLLGERFGTVIALACAALGLALLAAENAGQLPPAIHYSSATIWLLSCLYMGLVVVLLRLPAMLIKAALQHAESELSERRRTEGLLQENQHLLQTMIENMPGAVAMFDTQMRYMACSKRWLSDHHLENRDLKGLSHYKVLPEISEDWKAAHRRCLAGAREARDEDLFLRSDGSEDIIRWEVQPWLRAGGVIGGLAIFTEVITDRVRAREERIVLQNQLLEAQKFEALGTLAGGIAHDFNNILAMIGTNAELGLAETRDPTAHASFREIARATARARDVVRQILYFSRRHETTRETISLLPVIEDALEFLRETLPANVEFRKNLEKNLPPARVNASQIYQILMNLGVNAAHAMPAGGILSVGLERISAPNAEAAVPKDLEAGTYVRMTVQDTGTGMNKETVSRIFDPFFTTKGTEGTGLGLSVVQGLVKDHGGAITTESKPGKGSRFRIYFPAALAISPEIPPRIDRSIGAADRHIMYIDDEISVCSAMKRVLGFLGYRCSVYADAHAALDAFRSNPEGFDAIISDMIMPHLSGLEVARELYAIRGDVPIALTSGKFDQTFGESSHPEDIKVWLPKPWTIEALTVALEHLLRDGEPGGGVILGASGDQTPPPEGGERPIGRG
jgi:two-component system cell cycle sensor histidine kinase/response regulator CckA